MKELLLCVSGFLRCLQPVLVSRKDPDSRKNTILEISNRAKSGGHWQQVRSLHCFVCYLESESDSGFVRNVPLRQSHRHLQCGCTITQACSFRGIKYDVIEPTMSVSQPVKGFQRFRVCYSPMLKAGNYFRDLYFLFDLKKGLNAINSKQKRLSIILHSFP